MTGTDQFWHDINETRVRGVSLRYWPEEIALKERGPQIASTISKLKLWPARAEIGADSKDSSRIRKWSQESDVDLGEFGTVEGVAVLSRLAPKAENAETLLRSFHISQEWRSYYFEGAPGFLSIELALQLTRDFLPFITPRFGFSDIGRKGDAFWFHGGYPTSGMDEAREARAYAYQAVSLCKSGDENFLGNRLLDIYELNVLSPKHMALRVFGTSLEDWISSGRRGRLIELKKDVYAWVVPDDILAEIRAAFLRAGYLIVPV